MRAGLVQAIVVAVPVTAGPALALTYAEARLGPFEQVGWGWVWQLLLSLPLAALLIVVAISLAWLVFSRRSLSALSVLCILFAMPIHAYRTIGYLNAAFDHRPGVPATVQCLRSVHPTNGSDFVEVTSWRNPRRTSKLTSGHLTREECANRRPIGIVVHPGHLGMEWISPAR
jgi:hypothetical protein